MSTSAPSTAQRVREAVLAREIGKPFSLIELLDLGTRGAVDHAVGYLARQKVIKQVARGIYVRPKVSPLAGQVMPSPESIVRTWADASQYKVEVHGAEAARQFGLTTQMPVRPIFATTGPTRTIQLGKLKVELRHAAPSRLLLAGTGAGRAYAALRYLGKEEVTPSTIDIIKKSLSDEDFERLISERHRMPAWLGELLRSYDVESALV
jgi:hypothetical protein